MKAKRVRRQAPVDRSPLARARRLVGLPRVGTPTSFSPSTDDYLTTFPRGIVDPQGRPRLILGVTTYNRREYIEKFVTTFVATRSHRFHWTLVIADDGSTDTTLPYLERLQIPDCQLVVVKNKRASVAGQTNTIFAVAQQLGFDLGFKADDDIFFTEPGWDELYFDSAAASGFDHLIFHDTSWSPAEHDYAHPSLPLRSLVPAAKTMGCFWTFSPTLLQQVGFFDEPNFRLRGHSHWDFTFRSCRKGFNSESTAWDATGSGKYISMWPREGYLKTVNWKSAAVTSVLTKEERSRRQRILDDPTRTFVPETDTSLGLRPPAVRLMPYSEQTATRIRAVGLRPYGDHNRPPVDRVYILNLAAERHKWIRVAKELTFQSSPVERLPAVDGMTADLQHEWREYDAVGPTLPLEKKLRRRLIASPGAWGYLLSMKRAIERAKHDRLHSVAFFDDDVAFHHEAHGLLRRALSELPSDWKLLYLGGTQRNWRAAEPYSAHLYRPGTAIDGSYAFMVHHSTFDELLDSINKFEAPFDSGALSSLTLNHPAQTFVAWPNIAIADVRSSSLRGGRNQQDFAVAARWTLSDYAYDFSDTAPAAPNQGEMISIIVPLTHASRHHWNFLQALTTQSHLEFQVILVPDSTQRHVIEHALELGAIDSRFEVLEPAVPVRSDSLTNIGIRHARGSYLSFPSPTEVSHPNRLRDLLSLVRETGQPVAARLTPGAPHNASHAPSHERSILSVASGLIPSDVICQVGGVEAPGQRGVVDALRRRTLLNGASSEDVEVLRMRDIWVGFEPNVLRERDDRDAPRDLGASLDAIRRGTRPAEVKSLRSADRISYVVHPPE